MDKKLFTILCSIFCLTVPLNSSKMCLALVIQFNDQKRAPPIFHPVETKREKQRRIHATLFDLRCLLGIDMWTFLFTHTIEKSVPRIAVWHHEACRVMTNGDPEWRVVLSYPHTNNGLFLVLATVFIYLF